MLQRKVQDQRHFFDNLNKHIEDCVVNEELRIILGGDFNVTLDSDRDCSSGRPFRKDSVKDIQALCLDTILIWLTFGALEIRTLNALRGVKEIVSVKEYLIIG